MASLRGWHENTPMEAMRCALFGGDSFLLVGVWRVRCKGDAMKEKEFLDLARNYIWHDYVNAESEFEEVEALVALLKVVYLAGQKEANRSAIKVMREEGLGPFVMKHISRKLQP